MKSFDKLRMTTDNRFYFSAVVWLYPGTLRRGSGQAAAWYFVTLPKDIATEISDCFEPFKKGWGSLPVEVSIGSTTWKTSIFPDKKSGSYLLPIKAEVRKREEIGEGDSVAVRITIVVL